MKKHTGLVILAALVGTSLLAVKAAPHDKPTSRDGAGNLAQVTQLDKKLTDRIAEQQELLELVERLVSINIRQKTQGSENVLSGAAKPVPAPPPKAPVAKPVAAPAPPPWWSAYSPKMTYLSGSEQYAVINGKMYTQGQTMGKDVVVEKIESEAVVLRLGQEKHTYHLTK